jgi:hypothetical protein
VVLRAEQSDSDYSASSRISAAGIASVFADYFFDGKATGSVRRDGQPVPAKFEAESRSPRSDRRTKIDFEDGTPVRVSVEPPRKSAPDPASQGGTLDPVSAGFALLRDAPPDRLCNAAVDIFDGSRRSRLKLGPPVAEDGLIACKGTYARLEGEAHTLSAEREFPFRVVFRENGAGLAELDRIETSTGFGKAVIARRG